MPTGETALWITHLPPEVTTQRGFAEVLQSYRLEPELGEIDLLLRNSRRAPLVEYSEQVEKTKKFLLQYPSVSFLGYWDPKYPAKLRNIHTPPWGLYVLGDLSQFETALGIVGTRRPNAYGIEAVRQLVAGIKVRPLRIISGLAMGIDSEAHASANLCGIPNTAVLGSGLAEVYPRTRFVLMEEILKTKGSVVSEFSPFTPAYPSNFPRRNRIISGLSDAVLIVQGTKKSGTLHTARYALEQGRCVCVLPGDIFSDLSYVPHKLLREGAFPVVSAQDLDECLDSAKSQLSLELI